MHSDFDALIVGAGPAGCAAAYDLARAGRRVLLLDKRTFPRAKACACGLTRKTLKALRYSVDPVIERVCHNVVLQEAGPAFTTGARLAQKSCELRIRTHAPFCAMAVRSRFDQFCLDQTLAQGARFLRIDAVTALRELPDGIELDVILPGDPESPGATVTQTLRAPVLVGADGSNGQTRRLANFSSLPNTSSRPEPAHFAGEVERPAVVREAHAATLPPEPDWYARGFALEATVPFADLPARLPAGDAPHDLVFDFSPVAGGYGWLFPKGDHVNIGVGGFVPLTPGATAMEGSTLQYESPTRTLLAAYTEAKLGVDLARIPAAHIIGQHLGLGGDAYIPQGRVLLTGDAAGLVDPLTGEGIHSALISGQAAAAAILEALPERPAAHTASALQPPSSRPGHRALALRSRETRSSTAPSPAHANAATEAIALAAAYARHLAPLQQTLAFSHRAARSFYREPGRGMRAMRNPLLRPLILKTYADGLPHTQLLTRLARTVL